MARRLEVKRFIWQVYPKGGGVSVRGAQIIRGLRFGLNYKLREKTSA